MLSPLQERKIARLFEVLDADGDGFITTADRDRIVRRFIVQRNFTEGGPEHVALGRAYDSVSETLNPFRDGSGRVDRAGYLRYLGGVLSTPEAYDATVRRLADSIFDVLDADADDRVSEEELRQFYTAYSIDPGLAPDAFRKMDANGDGNISRSEVQEAVTQFYFSADDDAPGNWLLGAF